MGDATKETVERISTERLREIAERPWRLRDGDTVSIITEILALRQPDTSEGGGYIDPDTDQYVGPFTRCVCGNKRLALKGKFWCCTKCGGSWGENAGSAKTVAPPLNKPPTPEHVEGDVLSVGEMDSLVRRLRDYRPPSADPDFGREHHTICDEAADTLSAAQSSIQRAERERDEAVSSLLDGDGYVFWNPDSGEEYSENNPAQSGECDDAERVRNSTAQEDALWNAMQAEFSARISAEAQLEEARKVMEPFALISSEGVVRHEKGHATVTTSAEYFHRARAFLASFREKQYAE